MTYRLHIVVSNLLLAFMLLGLHSGCRSFDGFGHGPYSSQEQSWRDPPIGPGLEPAYLVLPQRSPSQPHPDLPLGAPLVFIFNNWHYGNVLEGKATTIDQLLYYGFPPPKQPDVGLPFVEDSGVISITFRRDQIGSTNRIELQGAPGTADIGAADEYVLSIGNFDTGTLRWRIFVRSTNGLMSQLFEEEVGTPPSTNTSGSSAVLSSTGSFAFSIVVVHEGKILTFHLWHS